MEETLSPFGIARGAFRHETGGDRACIKAVDARYVKDHTSPPRLAPLIGLHHEIEIVRASAERRESHIVAAMHELEAKLTVEANGAMSLVASVTALMLSIIGNTCPPLENLVGLPCRTSDLGRLLVCKRSATGNIAGTVQTVVMRFAPRLGGTI